MDGMDDPKVVNHVILVLIGRQGSYKTTWFNYILPPPLQQYFRRPVGQEPGEFMPVSLAQQLVGANITQKLSKGRKIQIQLIHLYSEKLSRVHAHIRTRNVS